MYVKPSTYRYINYNTLVMRSDYDALT